MVVGEADKPDGHPDAPQVKLSAIGSMVERELTTSITAHYSMIEVQDHVVMPDHLQVTPWLYNYRPKKESISVACCKTMNCVVQSLCRLKDSWWK